MRRIFLLLNKSGQNDGVSGHKVKWQAKSLSFDERLLADPLKMASRPS